MIIWGMNSLRLTHKLRIFKEYHSVCPLVGMGTLPTPLSPASVPLPPERGGWGRPNSDDWRKSLALCLLCELTLCLYDQVHGASSGTEGVTALALGRSIMVTGGGDGAIKLWNITTASPTLFKTIR
jgi:hypothetical protein